MRLTSWKHESIIKNLAESLQKFLYTEHIFISDDGHVKLNMLQADPNILHRKSKVSCFMEILFDTDV